MYKKSSYGKKSYNPNLHSEKRFDKTGHQVTRWVGKSEPEKPKQTKEEIAEEQFQNRLKSIHQFNEKYKRDYNYGDYFYVTENNTRKVCRLVGVSNHKTQGVELNFIDLGRRVGDAKYYKDNIKNLDDGNGCEVQDVNIKDIGKTIKLKRFTPEQYRKEILETKCVGDIEAQFKYLRDNKDTDFDAQEMYNALEKGVFGSFWVMDMRGTQVEKPLSATVKMKFPDIAFAVQAMSAHINTASGKTIRDWSAVANMISFKDHYDPTQSFYYRFQTETKINAVKIARGEKEIDLKDTGRYQYGSYSYNQYPEAYVISNGNSNNLVFKQENTKENVVFNISKFSKQIIDKSKEVFDDKTLDGLGNLENKTFAAEREVIVKNPKKITKENLDHYAESSWSGLNNRGGFDEDRKPSSAKSVDDLSGTEIFTEKLNIWQLGESKEGETKYSEGELKEFNIGFLKEDLDDIKFRYEEMLRIRQEKINSYNEDVEIHNT